MSTRDLIDAIQSGDTVAIQSTFEAALSSRIATRLDTMRQEVAKNMFNEAAKSMKAEEEEVQAEEVEAIDEEQLDELSPGTVKRYQTRAQDDRADLKDQEKEVKRDIKSDPENADFHKDTLSRTQDYIKRRDKGLSMAKKRLGK